METIRRSAATEEASLGILSHATFDVLSETGAVEFVNGLNNPFEQLTGGAIVQRFVNGNDFDTFALQQSLVGDRVNPASGTLGSARPLYRFRGRYW